MTTITINGTLSLGELLAFYRQMSGLDQVQMGELIGASRPTISAWERGLREPSFSQVVQWARIAGQPLTPLVEAAERLNAETASAEAEAVTELSQHSVRHKGLEPLTFWLGVILAHFSRPKHDALDTEYEALCAEAAIR